ncbi:MAG: hypothetical protein VX083_20210 [Pseudomonadota bacterium]|jgi:hypothetical protein|nr:hypothetical protein [Pseudomonadota bacterium]MEC8295825.1 hypothetical protein [Pseudomonadota bacterium]
MNIYAEKLAQLDAGTLDPAAFSHRDHVGVAIAVLQQGDFYDALARLSRGLQRLTLAAGVPEKFNATVTFASLSVIAEIEPQPGQDIDTLIDGHPDIMRPSVLKTLYSDSRMQSDIARRVPVLPLAS